MVTLSKSTPWMVAGEDYKVKSQVPTSLLGAPTVYLDRAGRVMVMSVSAPKNASGDALAAVEDGSNKTTILAQHGTPQAPRYIVSAVVAGHTIVWVETTQSNLDSMPWQMYTYDLDSGTEKHIASYEWFKIANPPWPSDLAIQPQVIGNWIYFVAVDHLDRAKSIRDRSAYRVPINGGRDPELVVPDAGQVYADGTKLQAEIKGELVGWDPARGKDTGYLNATSRWVSFSTPAQGYVLDLKRGRLMGLKGAQGTSASHFTGNMLEYAILNDGSSPPIPHIALLPQ